MPLNFSLTGSNARRYFALASINLFVVTFAYLSFDGYEFYDDWAYIRSAHQVNNGTFSLANSHFNARWGIIFPLSALVKVFGMTDPIIIALPLMFTLITVNMAYCLFDPFLSSSSLITSNKGVKYEGFGASLLSNRKWIRNLMLFIQEKSNIGLMAAFFLAFDFYTLWFSRMVYPDVMLTTYVMGALVTLFYVRIKPGKSPLAFAALFVFCLFCGFVTKMTIVFVLPFLILVFIIDVTKKDNLVFWMWSLGIGLTALFAYFYYYYYHHGNPLIRFQLHVDTHYAFGGNYFHKPWTATLKRVTYEPLLMFINSGHVIYLVLGLPIYGRLLKRSVFDLKKPLNFWLLTLMSMLLTAWLMSTSWRCYNPISMLPRHFLMIIPVTCIVAAFGWRRSMNNQRSMLYYATAFVLTFIVAFYTGAGKVAWIYAGFVVYFTSMVLFTSSKIKAIIYPAFWLLFFVHPLYTMSKPSVTGYNDYKILIEKYFIEKKSKAFVYTHKALANAADYLNDFQPTSTEFIGYDPRHLQNNDAAIPQFIIINKYYIDYYPDALKNALQQLKSEGVVLELVEQRGANRMYRVLHLGK